MRVLDEEGEVVVNLTNVTSGEQLENEFETFFEEDELDVLGDSPFLGYNEFDNEEHFEGIDGFDKEMTVEDWFGDLQVFVNSVLIED